MPTLREVGTPYTINPNDETDFERNRVAFQKLLPDLLKQHEGQWVAIVNEQAVAFAPGANQVLEKVATLGDVPLYIQEVRAQPRIFKMTSRRIVPLTSTL